MSKSEHHTLERLPNELSTLIITNCFPGPFPNFDPVSGPSQMLMATPVTSGATIIAVPTGPPPPAHAPQPPHGQQHTIKHISGQQSGHQPPAAQGSGQHSGQQAPVWHPPHPHMLHWDQLHPGGQIIPLRQPCGPVYYNLPPGGSANSSGLQSPASEGGSCMSESSSTSGDQDMSEASSTGHNTQHMAGVTGKQMFWQPPGPGYHHMPPMMPGYPAQHVRNSFQVRCKFEDRNSKLLISKTTVTKMCSFFIWHLVRTQYDTSSAHCGVKMHFS